MDKKESKEVSMFVILDLDRTLINNDLLVEVVYRSLREIGFSDKEVAMLARAERHNRGKTFDVFGHLEAITAKKIDYSRLGEHILQKDTEGIIFEGAIELLEDLERSSTPHGIMTYGQAEWQAAKLNIFKKLVGRDEKLLPSVITSERNKAAFIDAHWYDEKTEIFTVPEGLSGVVGGVRTHSVVILDDKPANFETKNLSIHGLQVDNSSGSDRSLVRVAQELSKSLMY